MQCVIHPTKEGVNTCCECGTWLCDGCMIETGGRLFCRKCLQKAIAGSPLEPDRGEPPRAAERCECCPERHHINKFLLFVCSLILPGVNYMYEGLIKRGLFAITAFFVLVSVITVLHMPILGVLIAILWITTFFDGFHIRNKINSGIHVEDGIADIMSFVRRNRAVVATVAAVFLVLGFFSGGWRYSSIAAVVSGGGYGYAGRYSPLNSITPLLLLALGIFFLVRMFGKFGRKGCRNIDEKAFGGSEDRTDGMN